MWLDKRDSIRLWQCGVGGGGVIQGQVAWELKSGPGDVWMGGAGQEGDKDSGGKAKDDGGAVKVEHLLKLGLLHRWCVGCVQEWMNECQNTMLWWSSRS